MSRKQKFTLEDHVNSIIAAQGPKGALKKRYEYRKLEKILDEIHNTGWKLLDLRPYHFKRTIGMWKQGNKKNYKLAREATGELIEVLKERYKWDDNGVIKNITGRYFREEKIKYDTTLWGMLHRVYDDSFSKAMKDHYKNHSDSKVRKRFKDLREYHFRKSAKWTLKDGSKNYKLARQATGELIETLKNRYKFTDQEVIYNIKVRDFEKEEIKYGATLNGLLQIVYDGHLTKTIMDYYSNHPDKKIKKRFSDLRNYHFKWSVRWVLQDGTKDYKLAREATGELIGILKKKYGWKDEEIIRNIKTKHFTKERIKYNATLGGMVDTVYDDSCSQAIMDYYNNHPDEDVRKQFEFLRSYHFIQAAKWTLKDGSKNHELAMEATGELIEVLKKKYKWDDKEVMQKTTVEHFHKEKIGFNAVLRGMLRKVYNSSAKAAINDYYAHRGQRK